VLAACRTPKSEEIICEDHAITPSMPCCQPGASASSSSRPIRRRPRTLLHGTGRTAGSWDEARGSGGPARGILLEHGVNPPKQQQILQTKGIIRFLRLRTRVEVAPVDTYFHRRALPRTVGGAPTGFAGVQQNAAGHCLSQKRRWNGSLVPTY